MPQAFLDVWHLQNAWVWLLLFGNLLLVIFAPKLIALFDHDEKPESSGFIRKVRILRILNLLMIVLIFLRFFTGQDQTDISRPWYMYVLGVLVILYLAYLSAHIASYFIIQYYGREKDVDGIKRRIPNYQSRIISIFTSIFIAIIALISIVQFIEQDDLLKAGGVIGFIGVFFALTQSTWAPDIFSGLIILNSNMLEEGDIIEIHEQETIYGLVYKTRVFHTVILNLVNNHRIMIRNSRLRDFTVHNLSKFSSAKGLREMLSFKIGYEVAPEHVRRLFDRAFARIDENNAIAIENQHCYELGLHEAGDHALEWRVFYFTKATDSLPKTRQQIMEIILETSQEMDISLATPLTYSLDTPDKTLVS